MVKQRGSRQVLVLGKGLVGRGMVVHSMYRAAAEGMLLAVGLAGSVQAIVLLMTAERVACLQV